MTETLALPPVREERRVRIGARVPVYMEFEARPVLRPVARPELHGTPENPVAIEPPSLSFYYLHTFCDTTGATVPGPLNTYIQISLESSLAFGDFQRATIRALLLDAWNETHTLLGSGRVVPSAMPFGAGTTETDGLLAGVLFEQRDTVVRRELIGLTSEWSRRVPVETRIEDIDGMLAGMDATDPARQTLVGYRRTAEKEGLEAWSDSVLNYAGLEGTLRPHALLAGTYALGVASERHLQSWAAWDEVNYKVTILPRASALRVDAPRVRVGEGEHSRVRVYCAPQVLQYVYQWYSIYIVGTAFFFSEVAIASTGGFIDALPALPFAYSLGTSHGNARNSYAVSAFVEQKLSYRATLAADRALETWTPFFFFFLIARIQGKVTLTQINQPSGILAAVTSSGPAETPYVQYVWRATELVRPNIVLDQLALSTREVLGDDVLFITDD
jgi:hypothetical protein